eukprot:CAMPEP_0119516992 /NCGR_PEP_ID=MMETSP1344-20130328/34029_1 /TAXON_ID=236787 /ORGANISM="Florenciella parvula, Strain CCMP2471" /LENGTH=46 /DNA_ID= /DNA_START= /DNA_END= /DNA_ORIENTATION=
MFDPQQVSKKRKLANASHHATRIKAMVTELMASPEKDQIDTVTVQE